eukprot:CAMPEP_0118807306 /NCGR_PEP_ID=MMETSP1161-20130426/35025_1 /TAXON_ID=249345 /ORGANISM="Picochlorum oklahomensis, Strain CCMP2329" /LENGTH=415 /DNA_ID=CAMNT_0006736647 /DNA_START=469 /DNA_END=1713 /DNA_ORIENTATION=+
MQETHPTILAGSLWFDTKDLMESFHQKIENDKNIYFEKVRRFLDDAAVDQHGQDTEIICRRALSLAETAEVELMEKLPSCILYNFDNPNMRMHVDGDEGYQSCMEMLHGMHVRLHAAMLQQASERVHQKDELHGLCAHASMVTQDFSVCLMDHMQEALLALLARKKHHAETWQSTVVRLCYEKMNRSDENIQNTIEMAYDMESTMEHAIRRGIQDRLELEQDVISGVSTDINQRIEQTKTRLEAIKAMEEEIHEKKCSVKRLVKDVEREEHALQKTKSSQKQRMDHVRANQECMRKVQDRIQARHDKAASFLQKMSDKKRLLRQSERYVQARNKLVRYKMSCFKVLHTRLQNALLSMPNTNSCLECLDSSLTDLRTYLEQFKCASVSHSDVDTVDQGWSTASFWESIGDVAVPRK